MTRILDIPATQIFQGPNLWQQTIQYVQNSPATHKAAMVALPIFIVIGLFYLHSRQAKPTTPSTTPQTRSQLPGTLGTQSSGSPPDSAQQPLPINSTPTPSETPLPRKSILRRRGRLFPTPPSSTSSTGSSFHSASPILRGGKSATPSPMLSTPLRSNSSGLNGSFKAVNNSHVSEPYVDLSPLSESGSPAPQPSSFDEIVERLAQNPVTHWIIIRARESDVDWGIFCDETETDIESYCRSIVFRILAEFYPAMTFNEEEMGALRIEALTYLEEFKQKIDDNQQISREENEFLHFSQALEKFFPTIMQELRSARMASFASPPPVVESPINTPMRASDTPIKDLLKAREKELEKQLQSSQETLENASDKLTLNLETIRYACQWLEFQAELLEDATDSSFDLAEYRQRLRKSEERVAELEGLQNIAATEQETLGEIKRILETNPSVFSKLSAKSQEAKELLKLVADMRGQIELLQKQNEILQKERDVFEEKSRFLKKQAGITADKGSTPEIKSQAPKKKSNESPF